MIKRLVITLALAGLSGGALAADLRGPIIEAPPPLPVPVAGFSWTGGYAGLNVGYGGGRTDYSYDVGGMASSGGNASNGGSPYPPSGWDCGCDPNDPSYNPIAGGVPFQSHGSEKLRSSGVIGGAQIGYNYAITGFGGFGGLGGFGGYGHGGLSAVPVIGVEADFDGSGINSGGALSQFAQGFPVGINNYVGVESDLQYFGTVRGRLGVAFDRLLVYGTGGFAYGKTDAYVTSPNNGVFNRVSNFHTGVAYGGGFEFALTNNLLLRAEYLHLDLNRKAIVANGGDPWLNYSVYEKPSLDLVRAGLDYKFDFARAAPVIARY